MSSLNRLKTRWFYALTPYKSCEGMFSLLFPLFLFNTLQVSVSTIGVLVGLVSLGSVAGSMFWGYISDRYRARRGFIVLGCLWSGFCLAGMGGGLGLPLMVAASLIFGFFSIAPAPISSILIMETFPKAQWDHAFGTFNVLGGWGWIGGLLMGTWSLPLLEQWVGAKQSMQYAIWGLAAMMVMTAWWSARSIPQPKRQVRRQQFITVTNRLPRLPMTERVLYLPRRLLFVLRPQQLFKLRTLRSSPLQRYLAATALMFVGFITALTPLPLFLHDAYGMSTRLIFVLFLVRALASVPCYTLAGRWTPRFGSQRVQIVTLVGRCAAFCGLAGLWWVTDSTLALALLIVISIVIGGTWSGVAVAGPVMVGRLAAQNRQGEAMGFYNATQGVAQIVGALLGGCLAQWIGYYGAFMVAGVLLLPAIGLLAGIALHDDAMLAVDTSGPEPAR